MFSLWLLFAVLVREEFSHFLFRALPTPLLLSFLFETKNFGSNEKTGTRTLISHTMGNPLLKFSSPTFIRNLLLIRIPLLQTSNRRILLL